MFPEVAAAPVGKGKGKAGAAEGGTHASAISPLAEGSAPVVRTPLHAVPLAVAEAAAAARVDLSDDGVLIFDVETTGTDKRRDQVIELCVQFGVREGARARTWRFLPQVPISPGAQAVHGISMDDLASCPRFAACADEIAAMFAEAKVLIGYNLSFDIDMVQAEFERLRRAPLDLSGKTIVDPFRLWQQCEPRSLQHAHQRFVGEKFAAAHSAEADVAATGRVLRGMLETFGLVDRDWNGLADVCDPMRATWIGASRHIQWHVDEPGADAAQVVATGVAVFRFGKHMGREVFALAREDAGYLRWLLDKDFPAHVQEICRAALDHRDAAGFHAWLRQRFGGGEAPVATAEREQPTR
jgi:DNA polymerase-3 subunit epsilon